MAPYRNDLEKIKEMIHDVEVSETEAAAPEVDAMEAAALSTEDFKEYLKARCGSDEESDDSGTGEYWQQRNDEVRRSWLQRNDATTDDWLGGIEGRAAAESWSAELAERTMWKTQDKRYETEIQGPRMHFQNRLVDKSVDFVL